MSLIKYNYEKQTVDQYLETINEYHFEGDLKDVFEYVTKTFNRIKKEYQEEGKVIKEYRYSSYGKSYCDGTIEKHVKFDSIELILAYEDDCCGDNEHEFQVWGTRKMYPEEVEAYNQTQQKEKEDKLEADRKAFERMKQEHGWS